MTIETADAAAKLAATRKARRLSILLNLTLLGLLVLMWFALAMSTQTFFTSGNISNLLRQGAMFAIIAIGQTFVIITAGIDLSVGAVVGFTSVIVSWLLVAGYPIWISVLLTLMVGMAIGIFHGFGVVQLRLPPFIMTLATLTALRGIGLLITNGATISGLPDAFTDVSRTEFLSIPFLFWMVILVAIPSYIFLNHTRWGRYLYAIGSNAEAARLSGVNVSRMIYVAYILSAVLAALVGVLLAARIGVGNATQGGGWELDSIASSVIGGTSLFGAVGTVQGPLIGSFLLATIRNGSNLLNVNPFWQQIITGALIIIIVYM
ncbi:MAG: ABC transporter permease, partial [Aestuariivirgaceae bacterium]|nr:ABC transporter permease [Aestuariivirgaceae bacterium]